MFMHLYWPIVDVPQWHAPPAVVQIFLAQLVRGTSEYEKLGRETSPHPITAAYGERGDINQPERSFPTVRLAV